MSCPEIGLRSVIIHTRAPTFQKPIFALSINCRALAVQEQKGWNDQPAAYDLEGGGYAVSTTRLLTLLMSVTHFAAAGCCFVSSFSQSCRDYEDSLRSRISLNSSLGAPWSQNGACTKRRRVHWSHWFVACETAIQDARNTKDCRVVYIVAQSANCRMAGGMQ